MLVRIEKYSDQLVFNLEATIQIAKSHFKQNKYQETINTCNQILAADNHSIEAIKLIAKSFLATRKIDDARLYLNQALNINPDDYEIIKDLGNTYQAVGDVNTAKKYYQKAIAIHSSYAPALTNLGNIELNTGDKQEALSLLIKATESDPQLAPAWGNLANGYFQTGKTQEAEVSIRKSIELNPNLFNSHFLLGSILIGQKKLPEAEQSLRKTIELNPDYAKAYEILGLILLEKNEYDLSLKYFSESAKLLNDPNQKESNKQRFTIISKAKIDHDIEQFEYLASKKSDDKKFTDLARLYKKVASEINWPSDNSLITLNTKHQSLLKDSYNRLIHIIEAPKLQKEAVSNSLNITKITNDYFDHEFGLTYIDNFLSPTAIESLRDFLLGSTIWFNLKQNGYVGAFLRDGFANPLIIQIADELRKKFPKIFKNYPINHIWAFKYDSRAKNEKSSLKGINIHADFAAVNVNFWITPKEANLNPNSGGLIVYDVEAPKEWDFNTFNNNEQKIREELKKSKGNSKVIPYNENRAVIFNSNLFHETDSYEFKEGYENRRINVTLLFGRREDS